MLETQHNNEISTWAESVTHPHIAVERFISPAHILRATNVLWHPSLR
jgi:hypothetical protein